MLDIGANTGAQTSPLISVERAGRAASALVTRQARAGDLEALLQLEKSFPTDRLTAADFLAEIARREPNLLVAARRERIVGYALGKPNRRTGSMRLFSLVTAPSERRVGVGGALLNAIERRAIENGFRSVHLEVRGDNAIAESFYRRRGYERFGAYYRFYEDGQKAARLRKVVRADA